MIDVIDDVLILVSYVSISKYRLKVINNLNEGQVKIPTELAKNSHIRVNHISKVLRELKEKGIIECINPDFRKGRLYRLTPLGVTVKKHLNKMREE